MERFQDIILFMARFSSVLPLYERFRLDSQVGLLFYTKPQSHYRFDTVFNRTVPMPPFV
jgi:hypothetical protein